MKKSMYRYLGTGLLMGAALGCGAQRDGEESEFLAGVPEAAALQLSITGDASEEGLAGDDARRSAASAWRWRHQRSVTARAWCARARPCAS
jgi:hypothetical protein